LTVNVCYPLEIANFTIAQCWFLLGLWQQYNRMCQWRLVWWRQRSRLGRFEAGTWWCMLCSLSYLSLVNLYEHDNYSV